ncbi:hypothetical protein NC661_12650 [Aquibacillus koreensis]|uniref:Uncharacterized protein n=1 Tax=Aquibacillus koreensis TaxID=279446 RepID=A0A9X3WN38_9BACI|nr:hypothetical protein [Aquibacillus koreensis]MCT2537745.1 hypothetical protein [Aquibacillus koreensis]MDC3421221.1 hypothetical protein [Aquibacillus koreensis]
MRWLSRIFSKRRCYICNQKPQQAQKYIDDQGNEVLVCYKCVTYAERRALRKS